MACLFMLVFLGSSITRYVKNTLVKLEYSAKVLIGTLFHYKVAKINLFDS